MLLDSSPFSTLSNITGFLKLCSLFKQIRSWSFIPFTPTLTYFPWPILQARFGKLRVGMNLSLLLSSVTSWTSLLQEQIILPHFLKNILVMYIFCWKNRGHCLICYYFKVIITLVSLDFRGGWRIGCYYRVVTITEDAIIGFDCIQLIIE